MSHTPGPWKWDDYSLVAPSVSTDDERHWVVSVDLYEQLAVDPDDARLIASAPDLLEALQALLRFVTASIDDLDEAERRRNPVWSYSFSDAASLEQARAVLRKALGTEEGKAGEK